MNYKNQKGTLSLPPLPQLSYNFLYVHNLPVNCDKSLRNAVKLRLRRLSDNCGGKVLSMSQGSAVLRFGSPEAAARARKRMEHEDVFGRRISLSFSPHPRDYASPEPGLQSHPLPQNATLPQPYQSQDSMFAPPPSLSSFSFLPLEKPRSPRRPRRATRPSHTSGQVPERLCSPRRGCSGPPGGTPAKPQKVSRLISACFPLTSIALYPCLGYFVNNRLIPLPSVLQSRFLAALTNSLWLLANLQLQLLVLYVAPSVSHVL